jgi:hypothetical protein
MRVINLHNSRSHYNKVLSILNIFPVIILHSIIESLSSFHPTDEGLLALE